MKAPPPGPPPTEAPISDRDSARARDRRPSPSPGVLERFFADPRVETVLGGLILAWVALTVVETTQRPIDTRLLRVSEIISLLFTTELVLRLRAVRPPKRFFREYWLDIVSVLPVFTIFLARDEREPPTWILLLGLLRIVRLFRLLKIAESRALVFPSVLRKGARELFFAAGIVMLAVVFASSALVLFEHEQNPQLRTFGQALWFAVYSVVAAEPIPGPPMTVGGHIVALLVILTGVFSFATVVGTVSALVSERLHNREVVVDWADLKHHLIVCGWSRKAEIVIGEYLAAFPDERHPIVVVAEFEGELPQFREASLRNRVQFLNEDFTKLDALEKAGVRRAARCILLADASRGRKERDVDARTVLAALTIERLNPDVYTVAEINRREHAHHLEMGKVNAYVVGGEQSAFLLAQSAITRGVMSVFEELMTHSQGNRFTRAAVPASWRGKRFLDLLVHVKERHDAIVVGVETEGRIIVNPSSYVFVGGEDVILITERVVEL